METPSYIALSQQAALRRQMDMVSNNIANMNTTGYKQQRMLFTEFLERPAMHERVSFVQDRAMVRDLAAGGQVSTSNALDMALSGDGYFTVDTASGRRYTRDGSFRLNDQRQIVNGNGLPVLSDAGQPIAIPDGSGPISVRGDGTVATDAGPLGRLNIVAFKNEQLMTEVGNGLYVSDETPQAAPATTTVNQGVLEQSNVNPVAEMTRLIEINRQYQQVQGMIQNEHDRIRNVIQKLGHAA